jgi:quercetin dioxygenase-like cupin family protein
MKLYQATRGGICAGLVESDSGHIREAAPILGGASLKGKLGWWVIKKLESKGYSVTLVRMEAAKLLSRHRHHSANSVLAYVASSPSKSL